MKKIYLSLVAICLSASMFAYDSAVEGQAYYGSSCQAYGLSDGTVAVTAYYLAENSTEVWIPATLQVWENEVMTAEYQVSQVGYSTWGALWVDNAGVNALTSVTALTIADGVKVHDGAFWGASALATLTLEGNIVVGGWAFGSCDALTSIVFNGTSVPACGEGAFQGGASWDAIINNCTVTVKDNAAKESFNHDPWDYWTAFYTAEKVVVKSGTGIENTSVAKKAQKVIRDGKLFIVRDGHCFDATGARVQ